MKIKFLFLFLLQLFFMAPVFSGALTITHLVVFGDSLSDRGFSQYGGFNRYSNGQVWPEYLAESLCKTCLQDYAWGGAKSDYSNYNGFNWSGLLWQIEKYKLNTDTEKTLFIIWAGANDLLNGDLNGEKAASNIMLAINKLVAIGAKNIAAFNLPDFSLVPAYNNSNLEDYNKFSPVKKAVKIQIITYNKMLNKLFLDKKKEYADKHQMTNLYLIDFASIFNKIINSNYYKNTHDIWFGTYEFPYDNGYMWWDSFHPMTSVHKYIASNVEKEFKKKGIAFRDKRE